MSDDEKKKRPEIVYADGIFDDIPEEERPGIIQEIEKLSEDYDFENPIGHPVLHVEKGAPCPLCGGELTDPHVAALPEGKLVEFVECEACDRSFEREPSDS